MRMRGASRWRLPCAMRRGNVGCESHLPEKRQARRRSGAGNALDRLDHLLEELANQPGGFNVATLARLQNEINADGLLFEVRCCVRGCRINRRPRPARRKGARYE